MRKIKLNVDETIKYYSVEEVMNDHDFEKVEELRTYKNVYTKNNKYYAVIEALFFNTICYDIELLEVDSISEYIIDEEEKIKIELEEKLLNKEMTLSDLDSQCIEITDDSTSIYDCDFDWDVLEEEMSGSWAYGMNEELIGVFDIQFDVINLNKEDDEDEDYINNMIVRVVEIDIL